MPSAQPPLLYKTENGLGKPGMLCYNETVPS